MNLVIAGTGSSGNSYILHGKNECVVLDCGVNLKIVKRYLDYKVENMKFAICTHIHSDHSKYIHDYLKMGIRVFMPEQVKQRYKNEPLAIPICPMKRFSCDGFSIIPFNVPHDKDVECLAYLIENDCMGKLLYMTDCAYCEYDLSKQKINHLLVECNYSKDLIYDGYEKFLRDRVLQTHMELQTTKAFILANKTASLNNVILIHTSLENMDMGVMEQEIKGICGDRVIVNIAKPGLSVPINKCPF